MSKKQYDEKQIIERGKSFQYAFTGAIVVNIIIYLLSDFVGIGFANGAICLINIGLPIEIYSLSMIIKNSYDGVSNAGEKLKLHNNFVMQLQHLQACFIVQNIKNILKMYNSY